MPALPVDVVHAPAAAAEQEDSRRVLFPEERRFIDEAQLPPPVQHGKERRRHEDREQLQKVAAAVGVFTLSAQPEDSLVAREDLCLEHPVDEPLDLAGRHGREGGHAGEPVEPAAPADPALLEREGHQLLGQDVVGLRGRHDRFDVASRPEIDQAGGLDERVVAGGQKQAVARRARPPPRAAHPLQEARDRRRRVDLDHSIQIAHVNAQFQRAGGDDHAVLARGERLFRLPALLLAERAVRDQRRGLELPQLGAQLLGARPAVDEHQPLLAPVEPGDHDRRVLERTGVVERHVGVAGPLAERQEDAAAAPAGAGQPVDQRRRIAHRGRKADPLNLAPREA